MKRCLLGLVMVVGAASYSLVDSHIGNNFFDGFSFYSDDDPTNGYVYYTTAQEAWSWGLVSTTSSQATIKADSWSVSSGSGRASVRIESTKTWNQGIFAIDLDHMPAGCGTWPAFWLCGPNWPNGGEIDIIEGVNVQVSDQTTLHTNDGCDMSAEPSYMFTGNWGTGPSGNNADNCYVYASDQYSNQGCGIVTSESYTFGTPFNQKGGGVYALVWNSTGIASYFWLHNSVPSDLKSDQPNPNSWGTPYAYFMLGSNCASNHFYDQSIIINLTFCGDWAGSNFPYDCPNMGTCDSYVQNNPSAFTESYFTINYLKVYQ
ncbi:glycoside hydrolase family 16 protein [Pelomyxa schiedti]|nr:glycoside hydrolase family 16 protein [Pelomyxa schiedti]